MTYRTIEREIIEATREFASLTNAHYDEQTENMIVNALRELNQRLKNKVTK